MSTASLLKGEPAVFQEHDSKNFTENTWSTIRANKINPLITKPNELTCACTGNQIVKRTETHVSYTLTALLSIILHAL